MLSGDHMKEKITMDLAQRTNALDNPKMSYASKGVCLMKELGAKNLDSHTSGSAVHGDAVEAIKESSISPSPLLLLLRLQQIVAIASEAARQSLKKKGLHVPPWRRNEYMRTKWFSAYQRAASVEEAGGAENNSSDGIASFPCTADESCGKEVMTPAAIKGSTVFPVGEPGPRQFDTANGSSPVKLLSNVEKLRLLTKAGLLTAAENLGLSLSAVERLGLLSRAEEPGVLSAATDLATPGALLSLSLVLLALGPLSHA
ncbi:hypothetical protein ZIOFF_001781 [Zingiber officinale]|uniref:Uncharacterized protein n=1 Tax=Zingiber officinale TaxID=94328 RepID=A0A8J5LSG1_ZINOF|nr:hypothetical protein ZIOFF_001781 [Zingiber officinale]